METIQQLPDNVLQKQVCQECFQHLSVPPITINRLGKTVCGRCFDGSTESSVKATKSVYNVIAERFLFKCRNYLNGCTKVPSFAETKEHEEICNYEKQECFFCSFSGNLSQILNHSQKCHLQNVSFDGLFSFWLNNTAFKKKFIFFIHDNLFLVTVNVAEDLFTAIISPVTKNLPTIINQFGVKFFKLDDPLYFDFSSTDYGLLNVNLVNYYEKNIGELVTFFGPGIQVSCQILLGQFSLNDKEVEFQRRFAKLRDSERKLNDYKQKVQVQERKVAQQNDAYNTAMDIIKKMSCNIFRCCSCQKVTLKDTYYCLKMHCYCRGCLTNMCKICQTVREFKKLDGVDDLIVSCDWPECNRGVLIKDYLEHKTNCSKRPYKCPLQDCNEVVFSSEKLIEHWHSQVPALTYDVSIVCKEYGVKEYYWFVQKDLYHVWVNFTQSQIQVLIDEVDVLPNTISFKCIGFNGNYSGNVPSGTFCGKYHINVSNSVVMINNRANCATKIEISPS